ncbi:lysophospholipid acyltransferase family protein [Phreatobacter aquaticus]|uniref:lysophospholipid acyltransferase family protein n=1 Tax=Phreatobacter aquaticus TaxID=2570229 RepID=UPI00208ECD2A|nr:lysophospholipid acyltransferase family protein [Phreatobacter aquaticus]
MMNTDGGLGDFGRGGPSPFDTVRAVLWLLIMIIAALVLLPTQMVAHAFNLPIRRTVPMLFHRVVLKAFGARVTLRGEPTEHRPVLYVPNHVSWMDIMVLGAFAPVSFVAKSEIADWPVFGYLAKLQRSIFVDREKRHTTSKTADEMIQRMREGEPVVLFAEGTSSDGNRVMRFRPALIGAAESLARATGDTVWIQPIALAYRRINGLPSGRQHRPRLSWIGDIEMVPHAWALLKDGSVDVDLIFGNPIPFDPSADRKAIASFLERRVRTLHASALLGRESDLPPLTAL